MIKMDRDGHHFVNFLTGAHLNTILHLAEIDLPLQPELKDPRRSIFEQARFFIEAGLKRYLNQPRILEKYEWLAKYFNDCTKDYQNYDVDPILIK